MKNTPKCGIKEHTEHICKKCLVVNQSAHPPLKIHIFMSSRQCFVCSIGRCGFLGPGEIV